MIIFFSCAALLIAISMVFIFWPWLIQMHSLSADNASSALTAHDYSSKPDKKNERDLANVALYRDHLRELETTREQGLLDDAHFQQLKQDLEKNLLKDSEISTSTQSIHSKDATFKSKSRLSFAVLLGSIAGFPVIIFALYQHLGFMQAWELHESIQEKENIEAQLNASNDARLQERLLTLNQSLVVSLQQQTEETPNDLDSRVYLARLLADMGRYEGAIKQYKHVLERQSNSAQLLAELAQVLFLTSKQQVDSNAADYARKALAVQPNQLIALGLMGIHSFQNQQYQSAMAYWQRAIEQYPPNSPNALALINGIQKASALLSQQKSSEEEIGSEQSVGQLPSNEQLQDRLDKQTFGSNHPAITENTTGQSTTASGVRVKLAVSLAQGLEINPEHTLFVYARAWQGPKMPLAIYRGKVSELPLTIELNDSLSMMPSRTLSSAEHLELVARVSATGEAITQANDLVVTLGPVKPSSNSATVYPLVISKRVD